MRFSTLSNETLLHSFQEACRLQMNPEFIKMLEKEISDRGLHLPNTLRMNHYKKIN
ncbi:sporulation histidine kinase inhibitor Sda [Bacillus weihaiensis]|uniref:sporulation histidine kinase inhibitor Sda n=1 Tax=Bacillus weihaiensis TaxID=1547283 RepID=UPI001F24058E|nr:sporulation histidine kinase inhibitor Sda [Bacillus weihaiensis]